MGTEGDSRFVWSGGDIQIIMPEGSDDLLSRLERISSIPEAQEILSEAEQFLAGSQDVLEASKVRVELERVRKLAAA